MMKLSEELAMHDKAGHFGNELKGFIKRAKELESLLASLADCLRSTYSQSPEGKDYLAKLEGALK